MKKKLEYNKKVLTIIAMLLSLLLTSIIYNFNNKNSIKLVIIDDFGLTDIHWIISPIEIALASLIVFIFIVNIIDQLINKYKSYSTNVLVLLISALFLLYLSTFNGIISNPGFIYYNAKSYPYYPPDYLIVAIFILQLILLINIIITSIFIGNNHKKARMPNKAHMP